jgi:hypothetical protein
MRLISLPNVISQHLRNLNESCDRLSNTSSGKQQVTNLIYNDSSP